MSAPKARQRSGLEHRFAFCTHCETEMIRCGTCGNNTCNGGHGRLPDGSDCPHCVDAYALDARVLGAVRMHAKLLVDLKRAVELYETYGLVANSAECGEWVNAARDTIRRATRGEK